MKSAVHRHVDGERLRSDIEANAEFGSVGTSAARGRTVLPGTEANRKVRERFVERLRDTGLDVRVDSVGNIVGRWTPPDVSPSTAPVATGSHLDSVPCGGIFDGPLGVYGSLEAVRAIQAADVDIDRPIEVVCFTEEEGHRFSDGVLGSSVAAGQFDPEVARAIESDGGEKLETALDRIGFLGEGRLDASDWHSWLELHIEQGRQLETADVPVGIVTEIVGTVRCHVTIDGAASHTGTTPMGERADALAAASEFTLHLEDVAASMAETNPTVATVGAITAEPNAVNVVPGSVNLQIDIRDTADERIETVLEKAVEKLVSLERERGVETTLERPYDVEPVEMSEGCRKALASGAERVGVDSIRLHSGAGHDTMMVANATDAGLLFAPSKEGISHNPKEWTDWGDCTTATGVLAEGLVSLATNTETQ